MFPLPAALLVGWLLFQERPVKPQDPPVAGELKTTAIDAELHSALEAFKSAQGYRFTAEGHCSKPPVPALRSDEQKPAPPPAGSESKIASAKERADAPEVVKLDGSVERGKPVELKNEQIEAFRTAEKITYRMKGQERWTVASRPPLPVPGTDVKEPARRDENAQGEGRHGDAAGNPSPERPSASKSASADTSSLVMSVTRIPTPGELLDQLEAQVTSCARVTGDPKASGTVFECQLRPEAMRWMAVENRRDDAANAIGSWTLRITLKEGKVDQFVLESRAQFKAPEAPTKPPTDAPENPTNANTTPPSIFLTPPAGPIDVVYRSQVTEIGEIVVKVPEEVKKLLGR